jgi:predicted RNase H-like HicB family nuclease
LKILHLTAIVRKENPMYVSWCPELNIASQGKTIDEAMVNLKEAIDLYLEDEDAYVPDDLLNNEFKENPFITCLNIKA